MKLFLANLSGNLVALASVGFAGYLIINGKDHWGWFIFIAVVSAAHYDFSDKGKK